MAWRSCAKSRGNDGGVGGGRRGASDVSDYMEVKYHILARAKFISPPEVCVATDGPKVAE